MKTVCFVPIKVNAERVPETALKISDRITLQLKSYGKEN